MVEMFTAAVPAGGRVPRHEGGSGWAGRSAGRGRPNPIQRTSQVQWVTMSLLRLLQFRLEASGKVGWWFRPPWNKKEHCPSVLDGLRLMRRHRGRIQRFLSKSGREMRELPRETRHERGVRGCSAGIERCSRDRCSSQKRSVARRGPPERGGGMARSCNCTVFRGNYCPRTK